MSQLKSIIKAVPGLEWLATLGLAIYQTLSRRSLKSITYAPPGHFYSPLPDLKALAASPAPTALKAEDIQGIDLKSHAQLALLEAFAPHFAEPPFSATPMDGARYHSGNQFFGDGDGLILYGMLRHFSPARLVEVGSGFSSALMLDTLERHAMTTELTFVEPFSERLRGLLARGDQQHRLLEMPVQSVEMSVFEALDANDILFIDSSHVVKTGSDVAHLLFEVLPRLKPGVIIHVHDVLWPFEYPRDWILSGIAWNEAYVMRAFLMDNPRYEVLYYNDFIGTCYPDALAAASPVALDSAGGSLWLRKAG